MTTRFTSSLKEAFDYQIRSQSTSLTTRLVVKEVFDYQKVVVKEVFDYQSGRQRNRLTTGLVVKGIL